VLFDYLAALFVASCDLFTPNMSIFVALRNARGLEPGGDAQFNRMSLIAAQTAKQSRKLWISKRPTLERLEPVMQQQCQNPNDS